MKESIVVDMSECSCTISPDIYGHFAEHLGRCIYGGFWVGKASPIPNTDGYRTDVVEAFKEIHIPSLRWPGGCFADEYHWQDGIGPYETRKRMINTHWGGIVEDNSFGTHEFFGLCELLGCKPYVNGNVGSGTVQEMSEWVEYITFSGDSPMSRLRAQNGRAEPWKLDYFGVGNESWGCGGNMLPEHYASLYRQYQTYVRQYGSDKIFKIACGPNSSDWNWTDVVMKNAGQYMDGLSLHHYTIEPSWENKHTATDFGEDGWYRALSHASFMEELVRRHDEIMSKYDPHKRVALIVDEWGMWHAVEPGTNPGFLYQQNTMRDALVAGITLNIFNNHADRVRMANIAQAVNVLQSPVLTEGNRIVLTPTWYVFKLFKDHQGGTLLKSRAACAFCGIEGQKIPHISVSASKKEAVVTVTITNADYASSQDVAVSLAHISGSIQNVSASCLSGDTPAAHNTFASPDLVNETPLVAKVSMKDTVELTLPPHSVTLLHIAV